MYSCFMEEILSHIGGGIISRAQFLDENGAPKIGVDRG